MSLALQWSHAANSLDQIMRATTDPIITAVECDVMLGTANESDTQVYETPILAHPPHRASDISVATLLRLMTKQDDKGRRILKKHLKLDFKEIDVVVPSLQLLKMANLSNALGKTIFLNADVLVGPGRRRDTPVDPDSFLESCWNHIQSSEVRSTRMATFLRLVNFDSIITMLTAFQDKDIFYSLSLGYKCDWARDEPYQNDDVERMAQLVLKYRLTSDSGIGLVLALNARLLALKPGVFDTFLGTFPRSTILAWTGSGEPSIPKHLVDRISDHFATEGLQERIQFDCDIVQIGCMEQHMERREQISSLEIPFLWVGASFIAGVAIGALVGNKIR